MVSIKRFAVALGTFLLLFASASGAWAQDMKVGYVDLQRALLEVEDGKKAKARLKREFDKKQKQLDEKQKQVKKMKDELESGAMMMTEEAKRQKATELQKKMYELQQLYLQLQGDLTKKEAEATKEIFDRMGDIIQKIGRDKGYDLILEKTESSVLFARPSMDLTDEVIKRYNSRK
jgi:outer membrane protein